MMKNFTIFRIRFFAHPQEEKSNDIIVTEGKAVVWQELKQLFSPGEVLKQPFLCMPEDTYPKETLVVF